MADHYNQYLSASETMNKYELHRDESDVAYKRSTLIRNEDDVIDIMRKHYQPDDDVFVIRETLLNVDDFSDAELIKILSNALMYL